MSVKRDAVRGTLSREVVVSAAVGAFARSGFANVSLQDLATQLGVTRPALYYYFDNKLDVLVEIHRIAMTDLLRLTEEARHADRPAGEKLSQVLRGHLEAFARDSELMGVFLHEESNLPPSHLHEIRQQRRTYTDELVNIYKAGVAEGVLKDTDPAVTVQLLIGMCSWLHRWYQPGGKMSLAEVADIAISLAMNGCAPVAANMREGLPGAVDSKH